MNEKSMNQEQALGVLVQAAKVGQSKGAYSLEDAEVIAKAIRVFTPPEKQQTSKEELSDKSKEELSDKSKEENKK